VLRVTSIRSAVASQKCKGLPRPPGEAASVASGGGPGQRLSNQTPTRRSAATSPGGRGRCHWLNEFHQRPKVVQSVRKRLAVLYFRIASILIAFKSLVRVLPLFLSARPRTPLRVLCIMAFDTLQRLRHAKPLPAAKLRILAALLDFGACANAAFDDKQYCRRECRMTLQLLEEAGIRSSVVEYLRRLRELEGDRPLPGGDERRFERVSSYREAVVRLSLGMAAATADRNHCLDEGIRATYSDADLNFLFRIVMQCQIIDDVLDYAKDLSAGLPSFLTACKPLSRAMELTRLAALDYADARELPRTGDVFALRSALFLVSTFTKLAIVLRRRRRRSRV
jgi:hypothetical protein